MAADDALRIVHVAEQAGWPSFSDDPVHDWMVREALIRRGAHVVEAERQRQELEARVKATEKAVMDRVRGVMH